MRAIGRRATGDELLAFGVLLGRSGTTIESEISGTSMGNTLPPGCRIRIRLLSFPEYDAGQVVAFVSGNRIFVHRVIFRSRQGVLTRGDNHSWCDLPVPSSAVLGVVTHYLSQGEWRPLDDHPGFEHEGTKGKSALETLLRLCMRIDIRMARHVARALARAARWRRRLVTGPIQTM